MTPVPREVTAVAGCDCGGMQMHRTDCLIWQVPWEEARAAVDAAEDRLSAHVAGLGAGLPRST